MGCCNDPSGAARVSRERKVRTMTETPMDTPMDDVEGPADSGAGDQVVPGHEDGGADGDAAEGPADSGAGDPGTPGEHDGGADGGADASQ